MTKDFGIADETQAELYSTLTQLIDDPIDSISPKEAQIQITNDILRDTNYLTVVVDQLATIERTLETTRLGADPLRLQLKIDQHFQELVGQWNIAYEALNEEHYDPRDGPTARIRAHQSLEAAMATALDTAINGTTLSRIIPKDVYIDGEHSLSVWENGACLGISSVSFGLHKYYTRVDCDDVELMPDALLKRYDAAREASRGKWIITQLQGMPKTGELRKETNFRRALMDAWKKTNQIDLMLPAELTYWTLPAVREVSKEMGRALPLPTVLKMNYDFTAKRNGFVYNPSTSLWERKIK